jgi:uncharacterized protein
MWLNVDLDFQKVNRLVKRSSRLPSSISSGPVMNTLYLNAGVTRERMVGTKTAVSLPTHLVKIGTYTTLGAMAGQLWLLGIAAGAGAPVSNRVAKRLLKVMPEARFRAIVLGFMAVSGAMMIWQQRHAIAALFIAP